MKPRVARNAAGIALIAMLLLFSAALAGDSVTLLGFQIDFLGVESDTPVPGQTRWTYAVTADGDEDHGLSHWVIAVPDCYTIVAPANNSTYNTPTGAGFGCGTTYTCQSSSCEVKYGNDPTTGVDGVKFTCTPALSRTNTVTHIFQIVVASTDPRLGDGEAATKASTDAEAGTIDGPVCEPLAITMNSLDASSQGIPLAALLAVAALLVLGGGFMVLRRYSAAA